VIAAVGVLIDSALTLPDRFSPTTLASVPVPLLLHSLHEYASLIEGLLDDARPGRVLEIGAEAGEATRDLTRWCERHDAELVVVEPEPVPAIAELAAGSARITLIAGRSPAALAQVQRCDVCLIDGDHNYWTVKRELEWAVSQAEQAGEPLLAILHDVGWPCARRDQYYEPTALPPKAVHPHSFVEGARPGHPRTAPGGWRGRGSFAFAREEGGPDNGVLTAIEEVLEGHEDLRFAGVPAVFGLGVLWSHDASWADLVAARLAPWADSPLLERLERNRVDLFLRVVELQDEVDDLTRRQHGALSAVAGQLSTANAELAALRLERALAAERHA